MSILLINMLLSMFFIFFYHPLSMGLILLIQTILISLITGKLNMNFWYSYILFLIMVGAMLILFIYMTSLASNEKFILNKKLMFLSSIFFLIFLMFSILPLNNTFYKWNFQENMNFNSMTKYLNIPMNFIFLFMIIYLFLTLIAIVKITNFKKGPVRQLN
uniref:NADH-ubiquinone oxidoreductase chain 6 n=1 Tax=Scraptia sp. SCR01 TaxID=1205582 RepID=A0A0S2MSA2_9CUCU|nr:NADH deshydrogenase subunit 6 [Scraptia sp. SCR01]